MPVLDPRAADSGSESLFRDVFQGQIPLELLEMVAADLHLRRGVGDWRARAGAFGVAGE